MQGLSNIMKKVKEKSPLNYPIVRQMESLDPSVMIIDQRSRQVQEEDEGSFSDISAGQAARRCFW